MTLRLWRVWWITRKAALAGVAQDHEVPPLLVTLNSLQIEGWTIFSVVADPSNYRQPDPIYNRAVVVAYRREWCWRHYR